MDKTHIGRKVSRIRELRGMKQETLAEQLGISQQAVSKLEQSESIDETTLERVGKALGVNASTIKAFTEEAAIFNIQNNYEGSNQGAQNVAVANNHCTFNPLDKLMEVMDENRRLYEALLKEKEERIRLLEGRK